MQASRGRRIRRKRLGLNAATILATGFLTNFTATGAWAQASPAVTAQPDEQETAPAAEQPANEDIVVTGYRASLRSSTNARRESVGFSDSVFAEDIGQFPDSNIAESFNRIPGITISRETSGDGINVAIRGLGTNFTRVLLNGAPIAVASSGRTDSQNTNREVDLDLFPTELFTQLTVNKSALPSLLEGGAAGTINLRSARPFDNPGFHISYGAQATNTNTTDRWGYRGYVLASATTDTLGILVGVAGVRNETRVTGYETIGSTNPNLTAAQCGAATGCNATGGGNFTIPTNVPANAGNGLTTGAVIDRAFLLAANPGATIQQIDNGLIPRLGRPSDEYGQRDRISGIVALEWRPSDALHFYVDGMYGRRDNNLERIDMNLVGRNGAAIPLNLQFDRSDCSAGCAVTRGTFANAQFFLEYRPFIETTEFYGINPGLEWQIGDNLRLDIQGNYTRSDFRREVPTVLVNTPASSGVTATYDATGGGIPIITTNVDLNNPANFVWTGGRVNAQLEERETETKGIRGNLMWGDREFNVRVGGAYDDVSRRIRALDNSQAWQNAVCGNNPSVFLPSPNTQPQCRGLNLPGAAQAGDPTYPAYGTGFTAGRTGPITYGGSLIPQAVLANYLRPGPSGFVTVDFNRFAQDSNYAFFRDSAPEVGAANTGASGGFVREEVIGGYAEVNGDTYVGRHRFRYNMGLRYVHTDQTIGGLVSLTDPRNSVDPDGAGPLPATCPGTGNARDGSCYPNVTSFVQTFNSYDNWLPSANLSFNLLENVILRAALSRTLTRPNPNAMLPGVNFSSPSADVANVGNAALQPFLSDNIDLGVEWYTGGEGYIAVNAFRKRVTGFTVNGTVTQPFSFLANFGITFDSLTPTQQQAINARGGPGAATIVIQQQVNASGVLKVEGLEIAWVQPLDFLLGRIGINGFGFSANATFIDQEGTGSAPAIAVGVSPFTYNATFYYENHGISMRISTTFNEGSPASGLNQNGIPAAAIYGADYQQWDFASRFDLNRIFGGRHLPEFTFDVVNIFEEQQVSYFQFEAAPFTIYNPGRTVMVGLRGRF